MGLDDLGTLQLAIPLLALIVTLVVSGPATFLSHQAWGWSLSRLAAGRSVWPARLLSAGGLALTGLPVAYAGGLFLRLLGSIASLGLLVVGALAVAALVHAAYRDECVREAAGNSELGQALARVPWAGKRRAGLKDAAREVAVPSFAGETRRRVLLRAGLAVLPWGLVALLLS